MLSKRIAAISCVLVGLLLVTVACSDTTQTNSTIEPSPGGQDATPNRSGVSQATDQTDDSSLEILTKEISGKAFAVTGSGVIWTIAPDGPPRFHEGKRVAATVPLHLGYDDDLQSIVQPADRNQITFFDQGEWHAVPWSEPLGRRGKNGPQGRIVAGIDNVALVVGDELSLLIEGTQVIDSGELLSVLKENRDLVRRSFGPGVPHPIQLDNWRESTMIAADDQGHIWCVNEKSLRVLVNDDWIDSSEQLLELGKRHDFISFLIPGPGHRYFYVGDQKHRHDGGMSFIAKIDEAKLTLSPTHHTIESMSLYPAVCQPNEALWVASPDGGAAKSGDYYTGQSAIRFDRDGEQTDRLKMTGYPILSDPIGNMWFGQIRGSSRNQFNIVRDRKVIQQLEVPLGKAMDYRYSDSAPVFCDKSGSVYIYTDNGLQHMVADDKAPHRYSKGKFYKLGEARAVPRAYSKQGYCLWLVYDYMDPLKLMYLAKLPENH